MRNIDSEQRAYYERASRRIRLGRLPTGKEIGNFDLAAQPRISEQQLHELADGDLIRRHENLYICGPSGGGKTHLAAALGREWCYGGLDVLFINATLLVNRLSQARPNPARGIKVLDRYAALIVDDLGWAVKHCRIASDVFIELLRHRRNRGSVIVTTSPWWEWNKGGTDCQQLVELLLDNATILELENTCHSSRPKRPG